MGTPIAVSGLAYAHPGGELLFADVSFKVPAGGHAGLVGANGVGKSTLLRVLAGELPAAEGAASRSAGRALRHAPGRRRRATGTVRELLLAVAPAPRARRGPARPARPSAAWPPATRTPAWRLGEAIGTWSELGGYELEGAVGRRLPAHRPRRPAPRSATATATQLSGGERKRLVLELLFASDADVLLLDEPDNFLDVPAKRRARAAHPRDAEDGPADLPRPRAAARRRATRS